MIESRLFGVDPMDPGTYAAIAGLLVGRALQASLLAARRAADMDP
jgi:hypothetical protein